MDSQGSGSSCPWRFILPPPPPPLNLDNKSFILDDHSKLSECADISIINKFKSNLAIFFVTRFHTHTRRMGTSCPGRFTCPHAGWEQAVQDGLLAPPIWVSKIKLFCSYLLLQTIWMRGCIHSNYIFCQIKLIYLSHYFIHLVAGLGVSHPEQFFFPPPG